MSTDVMVRMWEVRAEPDGFEELLAWICEYAVPNVEHHPSHLDSEVFSSTDDRIVWLSRWRGLPAPLPSPPARLVARPPHSWDFTPVEF